MEHFDTTHNWDSNGRYIVQMPIVKDTVQLDLSKNIVVKRLNSTLIRLNKNPDIKKLYSDFLDEYENLGHMEEVKEDILPNPHYYIPQQAVLRPDKSTTKLRVVFTSGAPDLETAIKIQQQLIGMMNAGGIHLYKWCSNSCHLLSKVSTDDQEYVVGNDDHTSVKALGLS
ncbi:integrase catalytic domain-containing protein [Trichonephila inaurata madagascariensis]|uniref:Integrase catalytic domain-containing protein n=1 Tax=Trichonephila inaurata madagascariensis TaxID=2747483 RepID=A0A8X6J844_9ARAC|nr:integrase catalytic domain-containing protein [Trichonephila inaurata madagascariensis]